MLKMDVYLWTFTRYYEFLNQESINRKVKLVLIAMVLWFSRTDQIYQQKM